MDGASSQTVSGHFDGLLQVVIRRIVDLTDSIICCWNSGNCIGAIVCSRALLETLGFLHSLMTRAAKFAVDNKWEDVGKLITTYAFSSGRKAKKRSLEKKYKPPIISKMVIGLISDTFPGSQQHWEQICDIAHPNGEAMIFHSDDTITNEFAMADQRERERRSFVPVYNSLHLHAWLFIALTYADELGEWCRSGARVYYFR